MSRTLDRSAGRIGAGAAVAATALLGVALAAGLGTTVAGLAAVGGAGVLARSVVELDADANERRALGSVGAVAGTALIAVGVALAPPATRAVVAAGALATAAAGVDTAVGLDRGSGSRVARALGASAVVAGLVGLLACLVYLGVFRRAALTAVAAGRWTLGLSALSLLVALQAELLLAVFLLDRALVRLDRWVPESRMPERRAVLDRLRTTPFDVPRGYWVLLGVQIAAALTGWGPVWFESFLRSVPAFGPGLRALLSSGLLHAPFAALIGLSAAVVVADYVRALVVHTAGDRPPRTLAEAAGGLVASAVALPLNLAVVAEALYAAVPDGSLTAAALAGVGPAAASLGALTGVLATGVFLVALVLFGLIFLAAGTRFVPRRAGGFALASALCLFGSIVAATADAPAPLAFAGTGVALLVWDFGENAAGIGRGLGREAESRRAETVHVAGSLLVVAAGVVLATVGTYLLGPLAVPAGGRALLALVLALVALVALAAATRRE